MNARTIASALRRRYGTGDGTAIAFEVASGTGRHANRHVDAIVMELWPSRGLTLHAIEIKISKSDLKRELKDGAKAEDVAQHCDFFSIAAPLGLVKVADLPSAWGLIEMDAAETIRITKMAKKTKARPVDRGFMAAMLRAASKAPKVDYDAAITKYREGIYERFNAEVDKRVAERSKDGELWRGLQEELKKHGLTWMWGKDIENAVAFVLKGGVINAHTSVHNIEKVLREAAERIKEATAGLPANNVVELRKR